MEAVELLRIIDECREHLKQTEVDLALQTAIRIAQLREDYANLMWLELQARSVGKSKPVFNDPKYKLRFDADKYQELSKEEGKYFLRIRSIRALNSDGSVKDEEMICGLSIGEIESMVDRMGTVVRPSSPPVMTAREMQRWHSDQETAEYIAKFSTNEWIMILKRVRTRLFEFCNETEQQLRLGQRRSDVFAKNREFVKAELAAIAPDVYEQLSVAEGELVSPNLESLNHALLSCRRALKTLADVLYPARDEPVSGIDGVVRTLSDEKYLSRLIQHVSELEGKSNSKELIEQSIKQLGDRLESVNSFASKGVHANITKEEAEQCVIATFVLISDILRVKYLRGDESCGTQEHS